MLNLLCRSLTLMCFVVQIFPMAVATRSIPWWSLPLNWLIGQASAKPGLFGVSLPLNVLQYFSEISPGVCFSQPSSLIVRVPLQFYRLLRPNSIIKTRESSLWIPTPRSSRLLLCESRYSKLTRIWILIMYSATKLRHRNGTKFSCGGLDATG